jgi:hypothetical protein
MSEVRVEILSALCVSAPLCLSLFTQDASTNEQREVSIKLQNARLEKHRGTETQSALRI